MSVLRWRRLRMRRMAKSGIALIVLLVSVIVLPERAFAGWESAYNTVVNIKRVCRDGISFDAAVRDGAGPSGDYVNFAVVTDPPPSALPVPSDSVVIRAKIRIPKLYTPQAVSMPDGGTLKVSHLRSFVMRFYDNLTVGDTVALNVEDFFPELEFSQQTVGNCKMFL
jgi:hypothetical protein